MAGTYKLKMASGVKEVEVRGKLSGNRVLFTFEGNEYTSTQPQLFKSMGEDAEKEDKTPREKLAEAIQKAGEEELKKRSESEKQALKQTLMQGSSSASSDPRTKEFFYDDESDSEEEEEEKGEEVRLKKGRSYKTHTVKNKTTIEELKTILRDHGIKGFSGLNKAELRQLLRDNHVSA